MMPVCRDHQASPLPPDLKAEADAYEEASQCEQEARNAEYRSRQREEAARPAPKEPRTPDDWAWKRQEGKNFVAGLVIIGVIVLLFFSPALLALLD